VVKSHHQDAALFLLLANDQQEAEADEKIRFGLCGSVLLGSTNSSVLLGDHGGYTILTDHN
jgi:hypothetical protein